MSNHILTIGGATQDISFHSQDALILENPLPDLTKQKLLAFEFGAKINIQDVHLTFGGGAANTAINFKKLGFGTTTYLCVGHDTLGQQIIDNLEKHHVITQHIQKSVHKKSGFSCIILSKAKLGRDGDRTLFTYRGANEDLKITTHNLDFAVYSWIYISSLSQKHWQTDLGSLFKNAKNVNIAWNPGNLQLKSGLAKLSDFMRQTDVFILNKDEALELIKSTDKNWSSNNPRNIIKELQKYTGGILLLTDGPQGAYAWYDKHLYFEPASRVKEIDTTGVGDAFGSTFVAGLEIFKGDIQSSLNLAMCQAASVIKEYGAQQGLLTKKELLN